MKKRLLITGATSGIGLDFLKKNINKNYEFFLIGRNFSKIDSLIKNKKHKSKINIITNSSLPFRSSCGLTITNERGQH